MFRYYYCHRVVYGWKRPKYNLYALLIGACRSCLSFMRCTIYQIVKFAFSSYIFFVILNTLFQLKSERCTVHSVLLFHTFFSPLNSFFVLLESVTLVNTFSGDELWIKKRCCRKFHWLVSRYSYYPVFAFVFNFFSRHEFVNADDVMENCTHYCWLEIPEFQQQYSIAHTFIQL